MATKTGEVLRYLKENGSITSMEAIERFGATRLSAIIFNLRHNRGYDISTVPITSADRYGHQVTFAKYVLHKDHSEDSACKATDNVQGMRPEVASRDRAEA